MQVQQNNIISWHRSRACLLRSCCSTSHHKGYLVNNGNRTEWNPIFSVIIRVINKIGRPRSGSPICKSQVLPVYHNCYNFGKKHWNTFRTYISGRDNVSGKKFLHFENSPVFFAMVIVINSVIGKFSWVDLVWLPALIVRYTANCPITTIQNDKWKIKQLIHQSRLRKLQWLWLLLVSC